MSSHFSIDYRMAIVLNVEIFKCKVSHGHSHDGAGHGHSHGGGQGHSHGVPLSARNKRRDDQHQLTMNTDDEGMLDQLSNTLGHICTFFRAIIHTGSRNNHEKSQYK